MVSPLRVIALICPDCGRQLTGLAGDQVFFCLTCKHGLTPQGEDWTRYPLSLAAIEAPTAARLVHLPFWQLDIQASISGKNRQQEVASRHLLSLASIWVTGFALVRPSYFGDVGLVYTQKAVTFNPAPEFPPGFFIAGCSRTVADAGRYARLYAAQIIDKHTDITGMDIAVNITAARLWAVPFVDDQDKILDLIAGASLPAFAIDDLEDLRRK
jgi:hypothetical protein